MLCGSCSPLFHANGDICDPCIGPTKYAIVFVILVAGAATALLWYISQKLDMTKMVNGAKVAVSYLQVMGSSSSSYSIPWPSFMQGLLDQMRVALLDVYQVTAVDCLAPIDFYLPFWMTTIFVLSFLCVAVILHRLSKPIAKTCCKTFTVQQVKKFRSNVVKFTAIFMTVRLWEPIF